jgi:spermidine synthase
MPLSHVRRWRTRGKQDILSHRRFGVPVRTGRSDRRTNPENFPEMTTIRVDEAGAARTPGHVPLLVMLFIGSGCAALIYEVVWFQQLTLIIGSSAISMGVVLATFMGGMSIGSLMLPRWVGTKQHPLRVYAGLEAAIGVLGIIIYFALPWVGGLYTAIGGPGTTGLLVRGLVCALFLLPPTFLMGATLPAIARWVDATPRGVSWLGFFYGGNTLGAVFGSLLAGFYLLRVHDMMIAAFVAASINLGVAALAFAFSGVMKYEAPAEEPKPEDNRLPPGAWPVLIAIGVSGMGALAAEAIWTRLLSLMLGATTYTFSMILASFLLGIGLGSGVGSYFARSVRNPRIALGACQILLMGAIAWAAYCLTRSVPFWPINPYLASEPAFAFQIDLVRCLWTTLPAATLWGASFPLALAGIARREQDAGRLVGRVYAANTIGAIVGALFGSLLVIAWVGTQQAQRILIGFALVAALTVILPTVSAKTGELVFRARGAIGAAAAVVIAIFLAWSVAAVPPILVAYGRYAATWIGSHGEFIYVGEGMNSSMAVSRLANGVLNYHNAGKVQASSEPQDMRLQRMLGHLTTLVPENPSSVLVIGCGAGVTAGAVSVDPSVTSVTIAEIEPLVPEVVSKYFSAHNFSVVDNPKTTVRIDDARHFLLTTDQKFDAITSDPFDPWVKGAATLYTKEFFEVMREHLNPGGVVTVFVQLYEAGTPAVKSEIATFLEVFPNGVVFANTSNGQGYDVVLLGRNGDDPIDVDRVQGRLIDPAYAVVAQSLAEIGFYNAVDLFSTYAGDKDDLTPWLADAEINRDRNLRLQFLAGLGINTYEQDDMYRAMMSLRTWPENLFTGSAATMAPLQASLAW